MHRHSFTAAARRISGMLARDMRCAWLMVMMRQSHALASMANSLESFVRSSVSVRPLRFLGEKRVQTKHRPISDFFLWLCSFCSAVIVMNTVCVCDGCESTSVIACRGCRLRIYIFLSFFLWLFSLVTFANIIQYSRRSLWLVNTPARVVDGRSCERMSFHWISYTSK